MKHPIKAEDLRSLQAPIKEKDLAALARDGNAPLDYWNESRRSSA